MKLILGVILGGFVSWIISRWYYKASGQDLKRELSRQTTELNSVATLATFERMVASKKWTKEFLRNEEYWVCEADRTYQMKIGDDDRLFKEPWTARFPDPYTTMFHIELQVKGVTIKSLPFISADGARYVLPLPKQSVVGGARVFSWARNSMEYKIAEVIGSFYREQDLKGVASLTGVEIVQEWHGPQ